MNTARYVLEQNQAGIKAFYISRTKWTPDIAAATLFQTTKNAQTEKDLLPDGTDPRAIKIRTINLVLGKLVK